MEIRRLVREVENRVDADDAFAAQHPAGDLLAESARLMAEVEAMHRER